MNLEFVVIFSPEVLGFKLSVFIFFREIEDMADIVHKISHRNPT